MDDLFSEIFAWSFMVIFLIICINLGLAIIVFILVKN